MWIFAALSIIGNLFLTKSIPVSKSPNNSLFEISRSSGIKEDEHQGIDNVEMVNYTYKVPNRLFIPKISLDEIVLPVGLNEKKLVDVPSSNVGWYKGGVIPGEKGNATMQGHVTGVFNKLKLLGVGDKVYVDGRQFRVVETELVSKDKFDVQKVYGETDKKRLNLITCAGNIVNGDFDKRTIIYTEFVQ